MHQSEIRVRTTEGEQVLEAVVDGDWSYHETIGYRCYTVTHVPSGMCCRDMLTAEEAAELVRLINRNPVLRSLTLTPSLKVPRRWQHHFCQALEKIG